MSISNRMLRPSAMSASLRPNIAALPLLMMLGIATVPAALSGCSAGRAERGPLKVSLWTIDPDATRSAVVDRVMASLPAESRVDAARDAAEKQVAVADSYAFLELWSDGSYRWQGGTGARKLRSEGAWEQGVTESGFRVRLEPGTVAGEGIETKARDWIIIVDRERRTMRIVVDGQAPICLKRAD